MNSGYLIFAALMMARLGGVKTQIDSGGPWDKDLYRSSIVRRHESPRQLISPRRLHRFVETFCWRWVGSWAARCRSG